MTWLSAITLALIVRIVGHIFTVIFAACHGQAKEYIKRELKHHERMFTRRQLFTYQLLLTLLLAYIIFWVSGMITLIF